MKELSIEERAQRYDEVLERVVNIRTGKCETTFIFTEGLFNYLFPELEENNGEEVREAMIDFFKHEREEGVVVSHYGVNIERMIAWLEKQGQTFTKEDTDNANKVEPKDYNGIDPYFGKPVDKVEPKFKVGDWITDGQLTCKVLSLTGKSYELHLYNDDYCHFETDVQSVDKHYHLWTIQDTHDGDVLTSIGFHSNCTFILKGLDNWKFDEPNGDRAVATGYCCLSVSSDKIEFGIQGPDYVEVNTIKPATKIQRDLLFQKMKEAGYEWDAKKKELKKIERKPIVKDESVINILNKENQQVKQEDLIMKPSLKTKQNWSEEDKKRIQRISDFIWKNRKGDTDDIYQQEQDVKWLKSLRLQKQWKPSEKQIMCLQDALSDYHRRGYKAETLETLLKQLKQL